MITRYDMISFTILENFWNKSGFVVMYYIQEEMQRDMLIMGSKETGKYLSSNKRS